MKYRLDTNVVTELIIKESNPGVVRWIDEHDERAMFLSVVTFGELQKGIKKLSDENRAERLQTWVNQELAKRFEGRILSIDLDAALTWGRIQGVSEKDGVKLPDAPKSPSL